LSGKNLTVSDKRYDTLPHRNKNCGNGFAMQPTLFLKGELSCLTKVLIIRATTAVAQQTVPWTHLTRPAAVMPLKTVPMLTCLGIREDAPTRPPLLFITIGIRIATITLFGVKGFTISTI